jgi:gliding motility-associated-like protein
MQIYKIVNGQEMWVRFFGDYGNKEKCMKINKYLCTLIVAMCSLTGELRGDAISDMRMPPPASGRPTGYVPLPTNRLPRGGGAGGLVCFLENKGQIRDQHGNPRPDIDFRVATGDGLNIFIGAGRIHYQWSRSVANGSGEKDGLLTRGSADEGVVEMYRMDVTLQGANLSARVLTENRHFYYERYYLPHCGAYDVTAHAYRRITYPEVYPGIDWVLYIDDEGGLEYDFVVHPGADPAAIRLQYEGAGSLKLLPDGSLNAVTPLGSVTERAPYSFVKDGAPVASKFVLRDNILSFATAAYDPGKALVIDPMIQWGTYYGGADGDWRGTVVCDAAGNVYLAGDAASRNNIATTGAHQTLFAGGIDIFLAKFDSNGVRQWATYYGDASNDYGWSLACDGQSNLYIAGQTYSGFGMGTPGSHQPSYGGGSSDACLVKFNSNGILQWATYYGANGTDYGYAVTCDRQNNVYMAGYTTSTLNMSTTGAHQAANAGGEDAFLVKFNSAGVRQWATYYGGTDEDQARALSCDNLGNVYMAGYTLSTTGIATAGSHQTAAAGRFDAFLVKFTPTGTRQWATYYGGTEIDRAYAVLWEESGHVYLAGDTYSNGSIATGGSHQPAYAGGNRQDAFLAKFTDNGVRQWATYYGGALDDEAQTVACDAAGNVYLAGYANSVAGIATSDGPQSVIGGAQDAFLAKFNSGGQRQWATYLGGSGLDYAYGLAIDRDRIYMAGQSNSTTGIATPGSHQDGYGGGYYDDYLVRFNDCTPPPADLHYTGDTVFCQGHSLQLEANTGAGLSWQWQRDGVDIPGATSAQYNADTEGVYTVKVSRGSCGSTSQGVRVNVIPRPATPEARNNGPLCNGQTLHLAAPSAGAVAWNWTGPALFTSTARSPSLSNVQLRNAGVYKVTTVNEEGCVSDTGYTTVVVIPFSVRVPDTTVCYGIPATLHPIIYAPDSFSGYQYEWQPAEGLDNAWTRNPVLHRDPGTYTYRLTVTSGTPIQCTATDTAVITVRPGVVLTNVTESQIVKYEESVQLHAEGADYYIWTPGKYLDNPYAQSPVATPLETTEYTVEGFRIDGCSNTATVRVEVDLKVNDFIPTAFTPNGDGKNDVFRVANLTSQKLLEFRVFNRWGEEVFATMDKTKGWDGTYKGEPAPADTYTWYVRMIYPENPRKVKMYTGAVILVR